MAQSTWMRFTGADKTILAEVRVPKIPPRWFEKYLAEYNATAKRDLSMDEISPRQWVDELCSRNLPIPLHYPLLTKLVAEDFFVPVAELEKAEIKDEKGEVTGIDHTLIRTVLTSSDLNLAQKHKRDLTAEFGQIAKVPPEVIGQRPKQRIIHLPLLDPNEEKARTFAAFPSSFMVFVELEDSKPIERIAADVYGALESKQVQLLTPAGA